MPEDARQHRFLFASGERSLLQSGANTVNNDPGLLAPGPSARMAPAQAVVNVTTRSFFVMTAASGSLSRTMKSGDNITNGAILTLDGIEQQVTWYSGVQDLNSQLEHLQQGTTACGLLLQPEAW